TVRPRPTSTPWAYPPAPLGTTTLPRLTVTLVLVLTLWTLRRPPMLSNLPAPICTAGVAPRSAVRAVADHAVLDRESIRRRRGPGHRRRGRGAGDRRVGDQQGAGHEPDGRGNGAVFEEFEGRSDAQSARHGSQLQVEGGRAYPSTAAEAWDTFAIIC